MIKSRLKTLKFATFGFLVLLLALSPCSSVFAQGLGHGFHGTVKVAGEDASVGTVISAQVDETEYGSWEVTTAGQYALIVQDGIEDGATIHFYIDDQEAEQTFPFHDGWTTELNLTVVAPAPEPNISVSPTSKDFGEVTVGSSSSPQTFTVSNVGTATLTITDITISGPGSEEFSMSPYPDTIPAGDSAGVNVTFSPTSTGGKSATLAVTSNDPDEATVEVSLSGTGVTAGGGGAPSYTPPPAPTIDTDLFGTEGSFETDSDGEIQEEIVAASEDAMLTVTIPEGTIALDVEGEPLDTLEVAIDESPPDPPADANIIGLAYDFGPEGATFDPPITLEYSYDPDALPEGVAEEDLVLAYYDEATGEWVELDCVVDTENNTITASVSHFTTFAIIGTVTPPAPLVPLAPAAFSLSSLSVLPAEVEPNETVTIAVLLANTGGESGSYTVVLKIEGVKEADERVTIAAGESQDVSFSVTREEAGSYTVAVDGLSGSFTVVPVVVPPEPAAFSVSSLSVLPAEVEPGETVTITVLVANTGGESGSYTVVLKIDGVKEAEERVTVAAGESQDVSFSVIRDEPGTYSVSVDGLSGSFTVVAPEEEVPAKPGVNWPLIGGIIGGVVVLAGLLYYFLVFRRRAY